MSVCVCMCVASTPCRMERYTGGEFLRGNVCWKSCSVVGAGDIFFDRRGKNSRFCVSAFLQFYFIFKRKVR